jgi:phenylacetate-CoA ligase
MTHGVTVLCCTPTYAIRLAEVAAAEGMDLAKSKVRLLVLAGEPGASIPATRARLEQLWPGARPFDHHGMTEVGPVTWECPATPGVLHVLESGFLAEVVHPDSGAPVAAGEAGELVLTTLGRTGSPLLRYRTGDLVRPRFEPSATGTPPCACGRHELALEGGILGRADDMVVVRGVNVYPSAVEELVRACGGIAEYQVDITTERAMTEMRLRIEPEPGGGDREALAGRLAGLFQETLALRVPVTVVEAGTLPRFELKARRWNRA